jgi:hypothetical protein
MNVRDNNGVDLFELWERERTFVRADVIGTNIGLSFTGVVARHSTVELVLARESDELSISLFFGTYKVFEPSASDSPEPAWAHYRRVVQLTTDGGGQCTLYELKGPPPVRSEAPSDAQPVDAPDPLQRASPASAGR